MSTVHDLCAVLGMDFFSTVTEVHPSLNDSTGVQSAESDSCDNCGYRLAYEAGYSADSGFSRDQS